MAGAGGPAAPPVTPPWFPSWCLSSVTRGFLRPPPTTLVTPYGFHLWSFLRDTVGFSRSDITEWQPTYAFGWAACIPWAVSVVIGVAGIVIGGRPARQPGRLGWFV